MSLQIREINLTLRDFWDAASRSEFFGLGVLDAFLTVFYRTELIRDNFFTRSHLQRLNFIDKAASSLRQELSKPAYRGSFYRDIARVACRKSLRTVSLVLKAATQCIKEPCRVSNYLRVS